jgi:hypothetical protein
MSQGVDAYFFLKLGTTCLSLAIERELLRFLSFSLADGLDLTRYMLDWLLHDLRNKGTRQSL